MIPMKTNTDGVITFHRPFSVSLLKAQESTTGTKESTETRKSVFLTRSTSGSSNSGKTNTESPSRTTLGPTQASVSHTSLGQLQVKMVAENQQTRKTIKPFLVMENSLVKELERFLSQWNVTQLRRRELLHKRWTERVWCPIQRRVEERMSSCSTAQADRLQSLYSQFLHHCNTKGFVFLETYDPKEYNPFLLNIKKPCFKASSNYPASASRKTAAEDETKGNESSRVNTIPYHMRATATADGRCHHPRCWFSTCGSWQQPLSSQHLQPLPPPKSILS